MFCSIGTTLMYFREISVSPPEEQIPAVANLEPSSGRCIYIFVWCTNKEMFSLANSVKLNLSSLNAQEVCQNSVKL